MSGKEKCNFLKSLRQKIAEENHIDYVETPCDFDGECKGTCPKCDKELQDLTQKVGKLGLGLTAAVGVSLISLGLNGCTEDGRRSSYNNEDALGGETVWYESEEISCTEENGELSVSSDELEEYPEPLMGVAVP